MEWLCWPRPDSSFVVGPLLDPERGGAFTVEGVGAEEVRQEYVENTNVLPDGVQRTGGQLRADRLRAALCAVRPLLQTVDARPHPPSALRRAEGLVRCRPVREYGLAESASWRGSNHIEYTGLLDARPAHDERASHLCRGRAPLPARARRAHLPHLGQPLEGRHRGDGRALSRAHRRLLAPLGEGNAFRATTRPRSSARRSSWLHQYEDTGALLAASTTSLPEHPGSERTWDYRYCWLRDAYFTLNALSGSGQSEEMLLFLEFLRNRAGERGGSLQPRTGSTEGMRRRAGHRAPLGL